MAKKNKIFLQTELAQWVLNFISRLTINEQPLTFDLINEMIEKNNDKILSDKNLKKLYKNTVDKNIDANSKKMFKIAQNTFPFHVNKFLKLVDEIIFNIQTRWNNVNNFEQQLNLFNKIHVNLVDENQVITYTGAKTLHANLLNELKVVEENKFDSKVYHDRLMHLEYSELIYLLNEIANNILLNQQIMSSLNMLWKTISTNNIKFLKTSLFAILNDVKFELKSVAKITNDLSSYKDLNDLELLAEIRKQLNVKEILKDIDEELIEYKKLNDYLFQKYTITHHFVAKVFENEDIELFLTNVNRRSKKEITKLNQIDNTQDVEMINYIDEELNHFYANNVLLSALFDHIKNSNYWFDKKLVLDYQLIRLMLEKINVEVGIIISLLKFHTLLQNCSTKQHTALENNEDNEVVVNPAQDFINKKIVDVKFLCASNIVLNEIKTHLNYINVVLFDLENKYNTEQFEWETDLSLLRNDVNDKKVYVQKINWEKRLSTTIQGWDNGILIMEEPILSVAEGLHVVHDVPKQINKYEYIKEPICSTVVNDVKEPITIVKKEVKYLEEPIVSKIKVDIIKVQKAETIYEDNNYQDDDFEDVIVTEEKEQSPKYTIVDNANSEDEYVEVIVQKPVKEGIKVAESFRDIPEIIILNHGNETFPYTKKMIKINRMVIKEIQPVKVEQPKSKYKIVENKQSEQNNVINPPKKEEPVFFKKVEGEQVVKPKQTYRRMGSNFTNSKAFQDIVSAQKNTKNEINKKSSKPRSKSVSKEELIKNYRDPKKTNKK